VTPLELQALLKPLLDALRRLWDRGLTMAGVVAAFYRRRVLPLTERQLRLDEMMLDVFVESSRMASASLSTDELLRWVKGMVGRTYYTAPVLMRPDQGYVSLMSFWFLLPLLALSSSHPFHPYTGATGLPNRPTPDSGGHDWPGGASVGRREE
jgi:hypothetical protein